jgi:hypothetical protein
VDGFLKGTVNETEFVRVCKETYVAAISKQSRNLNFEELKVLPFIHEFAFCLYTDVELKSQIMSFRSILNGEQVYHYSSFIRISPPEVSDTWIFELYNNYPDIKLMDLCPLFKEHINSPTSVNDILYNSICDLLANLDFTTPEESGFNYINCSDNASLNDIEDRVFRVLSFYLGHRSFLMQISFLPNGDVVCIIT